MLAATAADGGVAGEVAWLGCPGGSGFEGAVGGDADWLAAWPGWGGDDSFDVVGPVGWLGAVVEGDGGAAGAGGAVLCGADDPTVEFP